MDRRHEECARKRHEGEQHGMMEYSRGGTGGEADGAPAPGALRVC